MYCVKCGKRIEEEAGFCGECGMPVLRNLTPERLGALEAQKRAFEQSKRKYCPRCGAKYPAGARFCVNCGSATEQKPAENRCQSCGAPRIPGARFCTRCGSRQNER